MLKALGIRHRTAVSYQMLGDALKALRQRAGLTQEALAEKAGVSVRGLRKLESGLVAGPRRATLEALADALELTEESRTAFFGTVGRVEEESVVEETVHVPRQLPPRLMPFVGRAEELEILDGALAGVKAELESAAATSVVTMSGPPGVGKTALAIEWGYRAASQFPDGQLYLNLRGFDAKNEPLTPDEALRVLMTSLGVPEAKICHGLEARIGQYRTLASAMRILVILDNAGDSDQVRPLLPAGPGAGALVVSRQRLRGLVSEVGAVPLGLGVLRPDESRELIALRLSSNKGTVDARTAELQPLVDLCSGLPLALALVASRAQLDPETIPQYSRMVATDRHRLSVFASGDGSTSIEKLLLGSMDGLSDDARQCLVVLGVGVSSEVSMTELASLFGRGHGEVLLLADELLDASLIQTASGGRLALHDLIWQFVADRARTDLSADEVSRCRKRLLDYFIHGSVAATAQFAPYRERSALSEPSAGVVVEEFGTVDEARDWMASVVGAALAAVRNAAASWGFPREGARLAEAIGAYLDIHGRWDDLLMAETTALRAGELLDDPMMQALACRRLAIAQARTGDAARAQESVHRALSIYSDLGDVEGQAYAHRLLGNLLDESGDPRAALDHRLRALNLFEQLGDDAGQTRALNAVGWSHAQLGDLAIALDYCTRSAELAALLKHVRSSASAWDSIGFIKHAMRDFEGAEYAYGQALIAWREIDERYYRARTLERLGRLRADAGDRGAAVDAFRSALALFEELDLTEVDGVRSCLSDLADRPGSNASLKSSDANRAQTASTGSFLRVVRG